MPQLYFGPQAPQSQWPYLRSRRELLKPLSGPGYQLDQYGRRGWDAGFSRAGVQQRHVPRCADADAVQELRSPHRRFLVSGFQARGADRLRHFLQPGYRQRGVRHGAKYCGTRHTDVGSKWRCGRRAKPFLQQRGARRQWRRRPDSASLRVRRRLLTTRRRTPCSTWSTCSASSAATG